MILLMMIVPITVLLVVVVAVKGLVVMAVTGAERVLDMNWNVVGKMKNQILGNAKAVVLVAFLEFSPVISLKKTQPKPCLFPVIFFLSHYPLFTLSITDTSLLQICLLCLE